MFAESKDEVALILSGTTTTANDLADDESYQHISIARPLSVVNWDLLKYVENDIQPSDDTADCILCSFKDMQAASDVSLSNGCLSVVILEAVHVSDS